MISKHIMTQSIISGTATAFKRLAGVHSSVLLGRTACASSRRLEKLISYMNDALRLVLIALLTMIWPDFIILIFLRHCLFCLFLIHFACIRDMDRISS